MSFVTMEGRRLQTKLSMGFLADKETPLHRKMAVRGSQMLRDAILRAKGYPVPEPEVVALQALVAPVFKARKCKRGRTRGKPIGWRKQFRPNCRVAQIQALIASHFELTVEELTSPGKQYRISHCRQIAEYLSRKKTKLSYPDIGKHFGGRDHTTVIHSCRQTEKRIAEGHKETIEALQAVYTVIGA